MSAMSLTPSRMATATPDSTVTGSGPGGSADTGATDSSKTADRIAPCAMPKGVPLP
jgi:hypothetical protein